MILQIIKAFSWLGLSRIFSGVITFLTLSLVANSLSVEDFGTYSTLLALFTLVSVGVQAGLGGTVTREFARQISSNINLAIASQLLKFGYTIISYIVYISALKYLDVQSTSLVNTLALFTLVLLTFDTYELYLRSQMKNMAIALITIANVSVFFVMRVINGGNVDQQLFIIIQFAQMASLPLLFFAYVFFTKRPNLKKANVAKTVNKVRELIPESTRILLGTIFAKLNYKIDIIIIHSLLNTATAGIYSISVFISELLSQIPNLLTTAAFPLFVRLKDNDKNKYLKLLPFCSVGFLAVGLIIACILRLSINNVITLFFSNQYVGAIELIKIHVFCLPFLFFRSFASKIILLEHVPNQSIYTHGLGAILNIALNFILIPIIGVSGAAIATVISYGISGIFAFMITAEGRSLLRLMFLGKEMS